MTQNTWIWIGLGATSSALGISCAVETSGDERDEVSEQSGRVVYGTDDRKEYSDTGVSDAERKLADAVALVVQSPGISCSGSSCSILRETVKLEHPRGSGNYVNGLCAGERFENQRRATGYGGTAFLVAPDIVVTAGHVASNLPCAQVKLAFGYKSTSGGDAPASVPASEVYSCVDYLRIDSLADFAVIKLDRAVAGRSPLPFRRTNKISPSAKLLLIGHPYGAPLKVVQGGSVVDQSEVLFFGATVDSFEGNSGSPIWNKDTGLVEGILVDGQADFNVVSPVANDPDGCLQVVACPNGGCAGGTESASRVSGIRDWVPSAALRTFSGASITVAESYAQEPVGDFDGDGLDDIFFYGGGNGAADRVYFGKFDKTFTIVDVNVPDGYGVPVVGDFDGDSKSDILWYVSGTGQDRIWWGSATRTALGTSVSTITQNGSGYSPVVGDFNGDGGADIFWYGRGASAPGELLWKSRKNRTGFDVASYTINGTAYYPAAGDFDGDGYGDIVWVKPGTSSTPAWYGGNGFSFVAETLAVPSTITSNHRPYAADFDGNDAKDILFYVAGDVADPILFFGYDTPRTFDTKSFSVNGTYQPIVGDFNGDSMGDVIWYGPGASSDSSWWGKLQ